jgi:hypothetical protein
MTVAEMAAKCQNGSIAVQLLMVGERELPFAAPSL